MINSKTAFLFLGLAFAFAAPVSAQTALTALSLEARSYNSATSWQERPYRPAGLVEVVTVPGHVLVDIRAVFDGPWDDDLSRISVNSRDIRLVLPDGTELAAVGGHPTWGQMTLQSRNISGRRPRDFPDDGGDIHWNAVFVAPKGTTQAVLRVTADDATFEGPVSVPPLTPPDTAASFASFEVETVRRFRRVNLEAGRNETAIGSSITAPDGQVLVELEVEVTGVASNQIDGDDRFTWHTHNFRLVDDQGRSLGLIGERFMDRILDSQFSGTDIGNDASRTMIWVAPEATGTARLLFGEVEVAQVDLTAAAITDTD